MAGKKKLNKIIAVCGHYLTDLHKALTDLAEAGMKIDASFSIAAGGEMDQPPADKSAIYFINEDAATTVGYLDAFQEFIKDGSHDKLVLLLSTPNVSDQDPAYAELITPYGDAIQKFAAEKTITDEQFEPDHLDGDVSSVSVQLLRRLGEVIEIKLPPGFELPADEPAVAPEATVEGPPTSPPAEEPAAEKKTDKVYDSIAARAKALAKAAKPGVKKDAPVPAKDIPAPPPAEKVKVEIKSAAPKAAAKIQIGKPKVVAETVQEVSKDASAVEEPEGITIEISGPVTIRISSAALASGQAVLK